MTRDPSPFPRVFTDTMEDKFFGGGRYLQHAASDRRSFIRQYAGMTPTEFRTFIDCLCAKPPDVVADRLFAVDHVYLGI